MAWVLAARSVPLSTGYPGPHMGCNRAFDEVELCVDKDMWDRYRTYVEGLQSSSLVTERQAR